MDTRKEKLLIYILFAVQIGLVGGYLYHQKTYWSEEILRVVYLDSDRVMSALSPFGPGFEKELVNSFASANGLKPVWIKAESFAQAMDMIQSGRASLLLSGPQNTLESWDNTVRGPEYMSGRIIVAHNQWRFPLKEINDLCLTRVVVPRRNVFSSKVAGLKDELGCSMELNMVEGTGTDFFDTLSSREYRFGLIDELSFDLWHGFYPQVLKTHDFDTEYGYFWIWSSRHRNLDRMLAGFWEETIHSDYLAALQDMYFGFFPPEKDSYQLRHFLRALEHRLPIYYEVITEAAREYSIDPLLLIALIYQESHFDPHAQSRTGVRGLLQITRDTADFIGIQDRLDPFESIRGGVRYLDFLLERVENTGAESWDKWFFTLAAYNQGLGHLYDAMELAERKGKNNLSWFELKQVYPLLSYTRYFETLPRGYARGFEAVSFVENIRYYYYILHSMLSLSRPEVEHLAGFLDFIPEDWPD